MQTTRQSQATTRAAQASAFTAKGSPVALNPQQLKQVSGGLPNGSWAPLANVQKLPNGSW